MVSFYYSKSFLTIPQKSLYSFVYELIYMLLGNNNLVWKFQLLYVCLLAEVAVSLAIVCVCYYCFYHFDSFYNHFFLLT